jgi:hypothetical protein
MTEAELRADIIKLADALNPPVCWIHLREARREPGVSLSAKLS